MTRLARTDEEMLTHEDFSLAMVLAGPIFILINIGALFSLFLAIGTILFVRNERNR